MFIIIQIFLQQTQFSKLRNIAQILTSFGWGIPVSSHTMSLDQFACERR